MKQTQAKRKVNPATKVRDLLQSTDTFASVLLILCLDTWHDCLGDPDDPHRGPWHQSTFRSEIHDTFGVKAPPAVIDKIMAAATIVTTDLFFKNLRCFVPLANILAGDEHDHGVWDKADAVECAWAITEALLLEPPDPGDTKVFADEIRHYISAVLKDEGFVTPPDVLKIAIDADFASKVNYDFADDPEMFDSIYKIQAGKTEDVTSLIRSNLSELREQLLDLPLQNGSTVELEQRIGKMLEASKSDEPTGPEAVL